MLKESKYVKSMRILSQIGMGKEPSPDDPSLIEQLSRNGYLIHRPGLREWGADRFELTLKAEKTFEEYRKIEKIRGGSRPSEGHQGR